MVACKLSRDHVLVAVALGQAHPGDENSTIFSEKNLSPTDLHALVECLQAALHQADDEDCRGHEGEEREGAKRGVVEKKRDTQASPPPR